MKKSAEGEEKERYCHACGECRIENMRLGTFWPYKERTHKKAILGLKKVFNFIIKHVGKLFDVNIILITTIF